MAKLTKRQLVSYAILSESGEDLTSGLLLFYQPIIAEFQGRIFNPKAVCDRVNETYFWAVNVDIVEDMIPTFEKAGWLTNQTPGQKNSSYIVNSFQSAEKSNEISSNVNAILQEASESFANFIKAISPLTTYAWTTAALEEILLNWLVSFGSDKRHIATIAETILKNRESHNKKSLDLDIYSASILKEDEVYLCARFIDDLYRKKSPLFEKLANITAVALIADVIQDFQKPDVKQIIKSDLMVYLDAPFLMDFIGVSGEQARKSAEYIVEGLKTLNCRIAAFEHSFDEIEDNLSAMFRLPAPNRFGRTADAIRRGEILEGFVKSVMKDPRHYASEMGVSRYEQKLDQFPNQHQYFSHELYDDLGARINWHEGRVKPRERDATSITVVMRRRVGVTTRNAFQAKHLLISNNTLLCEFARRFCLEKEIIRTKDVGPALHQRRLATMLWVTLGAEQMKEIPKRQLLAACERVLRLKPQLVDKAVSTMQRIRPEDYSQLELMLTQPRATQILMDKTLSVESILTDDNFEELFKQMRLSVASDIEEQSKQKIKKVRDEGAVEVDRLKSELTVADKAVQESNAALAQYRSEDHKMVLGWVLAANRVEKKIVLAEKILIVFLSLMMAVGSFFLDIGFFSQEYVFRTASSVAVLAIVFVFLPFFSSYPHVLMPWMAKFKSDFVQDRAREAGKVQLLDEYEIDFNATWLVRKRQANSHFDSLFS